MNERFVRPNIHAMRGYIPGFQPEGSGWIKLNQNESPYPPSPRALEAMAAALPAVRTYPESTSRPVREAAAALWGVAPEMVMVTNGSDEMLRILLQGCAGEHNEVWAFTPSYTYYRTLAEIQRAQFQLIPLSEDFGLPEELPSLTKARLVFLPNPNAQTGTIFSEKEIRRLSAAVPHGLLVIDEAYADFAGVTAVPLVAELPNLVVTRTLSKSYGLAGLRVGFGLARQELLFDLDKVRDFYDVGVVAQAGALAALTDTEYFAETVGRVVRTRGRLVAGLLSLAERVYPSGGNFVLARFADPPAREVHAELRARRILVRWFDHPRLEDCLRISVGTEEEVDALLAALEEIAGGPAEREGGA